MAHLMGKKKVKCLMSSSETHLSLNIMIGQCFHLAQRDCGVEELGAVVIPCPYLTICYLQLGSQDRAKIRKMFRGHM